MLHKSKSKQIFKLQFLLIIPVLAVFLISMNTKDVYVPLEVEYPVNDTTSNAKDIKIIFTKDMSDQTLESIKADLKNNDILMIIKKISRNNEDEITEIDVDFDTENGAANYNVVNSNGIAPFNFEMNASDGSFGVGSIKNHSSTNSSKFISETINKSEILGDSIRFEIDSTKSIKLISNALTIIDKNDSITYINASNAKNNTIFTNTDIVVYINNKQVGTEALKNILPDNIESMTVIRDKKELKKLNHADKDGVIQIVLKNQKKYSINPVGVSKIESKPKYETDPTKTFMFYEELMKSKLLSNIQFEDIDASLSNLRINYYITKYDTIVITHNGNRISRAEFDKINANDIQSIEVIKDPKKLSKLGYPDKKEIIILKTNALSNHLALKSHNTVTNYKVNGVAYLDDTDISKDGIINYIYKETTDEQLKLQIKKFKEFGVTMSYSKLKRNKNGDIINIKVRLQNDEGQEIEDTFSEKNGAVVMEYGLSNGKLKISKLTE